MSFFSIRFNPLIIIIYLCYVTVDITNFQVVADIRDDSSLIINKKADNYR